MWESQSLSAKERPRALSHLEKNENFKSEKRWHEYRIKANMPLGVNVLTHASSLKERPTIKALFSSCHAGMKSKVQREVKKATRKSLDIQTVVSLSCEGWPEQEHRVTDVQEEKLDVLGQGFSNCESRLWGWELEGRLGGRDVRWGCYMRWKGNFHSQSSKYNSVPCSVICPFYQLKQQLELQLETSLVPTIWPRSHFWDQIFSHSWCEH